MPKPTYCDVVLWCAAHNVSLTRDCSEVRATAYDFMSEAITTCSICRKVEALEAQEKDLDYALDACDMVAEEMLVLKPSIAFKLNQS